MFVFDFIFSWVRFFEGSFFESVVESLYIAVIGVFFGEVIDECIESFSDFDECLEGVIFLLDVTFFFYEKVMVINSEFCVLICLPDVAADNDESDYCYQAEENLLTQHLYIYVRNSLGFLVWGIMLREDIWIDRVVLVH